MSDVRIVRCEACGSEGRIYHGDGSHRLDWVEPCPYCQGTGGEMIEVEPITLDDLITLAEMEGPNVG